MSILNMINYSDGGGGGGSVTIKTTTKSLTSATHSLSFTLTSEPTNFFLMLATSVNISSLAENTIVCLAKRSNDTNVTGILYQDGALKVFTGGTTTSMSGITWTMTSAISWFAHAYKLYYTN